MIFGCIFGSQLHVDIHDPIYYYLDSQSTRGVLPFYMYSSLPPIRGYIDEMLIYLEKERDRLFTIDEKILMNIWLIIAMSLKINLIFI